MFSFRQKIIIGYLTVFLIFLILMFPIIRGWVNRIIFRAMEARTTEIISNIQDAPNNEALVRRLKDQKSIMFFRSSIITDEHKVLYDSHTKRLLGPKFSQEFIVDHPEVLQAFREGLGYNEDYSELLNQEFSYLAKAFDFHGHVYVLRTAFPFQYVLEITHDFEMGFLAFAFIILLMFSLLTWYIIHRLTKPIQKIIDAIKPYQEGFQSHLPAIEIGKSNSKDEFSKLASTLNGLSLKIQNHIDIITQERNEKEAILESLGEGVIAVDEEMNIAYTNFIAMKLLNRPNAKSVGEKFSFLRQERCERLLSDCQREMKLLTDTLELYSENKKRFIDVIAAPKKDNRGAILVLQDKTAHYKIFEMRRDFIANASHELKTPITVIRGFAEALHDNDNLPREMLELMTDKIMRSCTRMTALIKDLLTLADIENIPSSRLNPCDLALLSERCASMILEAFPDTEIEIRKEKADVSLIADVDLIELAIMNLIENGVKYSNRPARITLVLDENSEEVFIRITDRGIGIPEADREHIFDRFYTVDKAHSQKMGGSGLGLSIVKTIVEKHFGSIEVESEINKGTTFVIRLPKTDIDLEGS